VGVALACYATLAVRGLRIALLLRRAGRRLAAAAAAAALASQAAVAAAADLTLIPPTVVAAPILAPFLGGAWLTGTANGIAVGALLYISGAADWASAFGYGPARGPSLPPP
jgi:cell division protein FtsW (lipid II flippase)